MNRLAVALSGVAGLLLVSAPGFAADILLPGTAGVVQVLDVARFRALGGPFTLPPPSDDPTIEGGSVRFFDTAPGGDDETYPLPAANWSINAMTGFYQYNQPGPSTLTHPCQRVDLEDDEIFVRCIGSGVTMTTPFAGDLGVILTIGDTTRYCATFGGTTDVNSPRKLERHDAPAPVACPTPPTPQPELMPGKITVIRDGSLAKFVAKPTPGQTFDLPSAAVHPTILGASLRIRDLGGTGGDNTYALAAGGWVQTTKSGYKYGGAGQPGDPCKVVLIKTRVVKGICRSTDVTLDPTSFTGDVSVRLITGTGLNTKRYCAQYGGDDVSSPTVLRRRNAPAPAEVDCPSPSGAFLDVGPDLFD